MPSDEEPINLVPLLKRTFVWDVTPCQMVSQFFPALDLVPASVDGNDSEHTAKHQRLQRLDPIKAMIEVYAVIASEVISKVMLRCDVNETRQKLEDTGMLTIIIEQNQEIIRAALFASISQMLDTGVLTYGKGLE
jgi:hypothetical protein